MRYFAAPLFALAVLAGCGSGGSGDASAALEAQIARQLPGKVHRLAGPDAFVTGVRCVHGGGNSYQCIASVSGSNAYTGAPERTQLPLDATCDDRACIWKVSP
jgi:hypothetical protein